MARQVITVLVSVAGTIDQITKQTWSLLRILEGILSGAWFVSSADEWNVKHIITMMLYSRRYA